jgi:hypothetical protein
MQRARSVSAPPTLERPAAPEALPPSFADVNQFGIRILGLKSIPVEKGARLAALLGCAGELKRMPKQFVPLLVGELRAECAALPETEWRIAFNALDRS